MAKRGSDIKTIDNFEIHRDKIIISVNPKFYNLDVIYSAIYMFLDKCYCKVSGDPSEEIIVEIKPKESQDLENIGRQFNNELIGYAAIGIRGRKAADMRAEIIKRALETHGASPEEEKIDKQC